MQRNRIHFTFAKIMNKLISTKNLIFKSLDGPSGCGKTYLIHGWLKVGTIQPKFNEISFFYQHSQPLYDVMQKESDTFVFSLENNGTEYVLMFHYSSADISILKSLWTLLLLADISDLVLSTLNTTYSTKVN